MAVANRDDDTVTVLEGNGAGSLALAATVPTGATPTGIGVGDFNEDGALDIVVTNETDDDVSLLLTTP